MQIQRLSYHYGMKDARIAVYQIHDLILFSTRYLRSIEFR